MVEIHTHEELHKWGYSLIFMKYVVQRIHEKEKLKYVLNGDSKI